MQTEMLTGQALEVARSWAHARALDEALLLADLTQLSDESLPVGVFDGPHVRGLACCYTGLPFLAVALWCEGPEVAAALLSTLATHQPRLRHERAYALVAAPIYRQLAAVAEVEQALEETRRVLRPEAAAHPSPAAAQWRAVRLGPQDLDAVADLLRQEMPAAWTPRALEYGPCRGVFVDGRLAAMAGVHFSTPWVTEIGHIVTRPAYRRQGLAEAAIRALLGDLQGETEQVFLMHFDDNPAAEGLYGRLGFVPYGRLMLTRFRVRKERASF